MENRPDARKLVLRMKGRAEQIDAIKKQAKIPAKPAPKPGKEEDGITIKSCTPGSNKRFKITVDDSGVISAVEVK